MTYDPLREGCAAALKEVGRVVDEPPDPLGYGVDVWCQLDVTEDWQNTEQNSPENVVNEAIRALVTDRGSIIDDPDRGMNIAGRWNVMLDFTRIDELRADVYAEIMKDARVETATVSTTKYGLHGLDVGVSIQPKGADKSYDFVYRLSEGKAKLL